MRNSPWGRISSSCDGCNHTSCINLVDAQRKRGALILKSLLILFLLPFAARPEFERRESCSSSPQSYLEPVPTTEKGLLPADFVLEDPDSHYIYICRKMDDIELSKAPNSALTADVL